MLVWLRLLAIIALIGSGTAIYLAVDIHTNGALNNAGVERYPGANQVSAIGSTVVALGLLAVIAGTLLGIISNLQQRKWIWPLVLIGLLAVTAYATLDAGFTANPIIALLTLAAPLGLLILSLVFKSRWGEIAER